VIRHGSPRLDRVRGRFRKRLSEWKRHTAETSTRRGSGVLAGRCVLYPPHSTPNKTTLRSGWTSMLKNNLTEPTRLEISPKVGAYSCRTTLRRELWT